MTPFARDSLRSIMIGAAGGVVLFLVTNFANFVGITEEQKVEALFLRCSLRGGTEITDWKGHDVAYECFVDGKMVDRFRVDLSR